MLENQDFFCLALSQAREVFLCAEIQVHDKTEKLHRRFSLTERDEKPAVSATVERKDKIQNDKPGDEWESDVKISGIVEKASRREASVSEKMAAPRVKEGSFLLPWNSKHSFHPFRAARKKNRARRPQGAREIQLIRNRNRKCRNRRMCRVSHTGRHSGVTRPLHK